MQSIINNYALSVGDRLELYRKVRTEGLEKNSFFYQLVNLVTGGSEKKLIQNGPKTKQSLKQRVLDREIKKSRNERNYEVIDPLVQKEEAEADSQIQDSQESKKEVLLTESHLQKMLEEAELNELGLNPYSMYHFDRYRSHNN